ncbi:MAG: HEAT repeat domain-containing protein [Planctomycetales bacterium]|nr:HEAT repeat domain-containing protein [Planctomycetales bacterium]
MFRYHRLCVGLFGCLMLAAHASRLYAVEAAIQCRAYDQQRDFGIELEGDQRRYAPDRAADILHIRLDVTPNFTDRSVAGTTRIEFQPIAEPLTELKLDAIKLTIGTVTSDYGIQEVVNDDQHVTLRFERPVPVGEKAYVEIQHAAHPTRGLYFRTPAMGYPAEDIQVWTQGESHEARFWFPCFDYPNERSTTEVICHVPAAMTVLSNGRKIGETAEDGDMKRVHWIQEKPHVNYLICLVAGNFHQLTGQHGDTPLGFYAPPSLAEHAETAFSDTQRIMAFFESEIGVPFPWPKYDQAAVHDFIAGGMENTTLTVLTERTIRSRASENVNPSFPLDAHEMAHQWFGDYVTCKDWGHLWLNEGFATYYTHLYTGHRDGPDAMLYGLFQDAENRILPNSRDKRGIVYRDYKNPQEQFDYRSYPKGSWVLHMLRSQLGADAYRACIRDYLMQHALGNVVSDDLRQIIEKHSGKSFDRFFDQWVYHGGAPELKIKYDWQAKEGLAKLTVEQTHEVNDDILLFQIPAQVRFVVDGQAIEKDFEINQRKAEYFFALPGQPQTVRFDPHLSVLAKVAFDKPEAMYRFDLDQHDDMLGRILAVRDLAKQSTAENIERLQRVLREDAFYGVRIEASKALRKMDTPESLAALAAARQQEDARVREQVVGDLVGHYRTNSTDQVAEILSSEQNPEIQATALRSLGKLQGAASKTLLQEYLSRPSFRNVLAEAALDAMESQHRPAYRKPLLKWLESQTESLQTSTIRKALTTLAALSRDVKSKEAERKIIAQYLQDPRPPVQNAAARALGTLGDPAALPLLRSVRSSTQDNGLERAVDDAIRRINETRPLAPQEVVELRRELQTLRDEQKKLSDELKTLREQNAAAQETDKAAEK